MKSANPSILLTSSAFLFPLISIPDDYFQEKKSSIFHGFYFLRFFFFLTRDIGTSGQLGAWLSFTHRYCSGCPQLINILLKNFSSVQFTLQKVFFSSSLSIKRKYNERLSLIPPYSLSQYLTDHLWLNLIKLPHKRILNQLHLRLQR